VGNLRRTSRPKLPARPARQWEGDVLPTPRLAPVRVACNESALVASIPKGVAAKPGKQAPTKLESDWMDRIVAYGCIACRIDGRGFVAAAVHHILRGGRRIGHLFTLPLCDPGHHQNGAHLDKVSRHPWKARFEARYGTEFELLARLKRELGFFDEWKVTP
jgi:hypothetical protein